MIRQAVILVGGAGSRLGQLTATTPKPLLPIGGRPFLDHLLDEIARYGAFKTVLLLAGKHGRDVASRYDGMTRRGLTIHVIVEPEPLGTGGALVNARDRLESRFLLMNGDSFLDCNLLDLAAAPWPDGVQARLALLKDHPDDRYGRVELDGDRIAAFRSPGAGLRGPVNAGIYIFEQAAIDRLGRAPCSLESDILAPLAREKRLQGRLYDRFFIDIGIPDDFARADREFVRHLRRPAVFFDRDGVLNHDLDYVHLPEQVRWIDGAKEAVKLCNDLGYFVFVVTNQAGVARGLYNEAKVRALHDWMNEQFNIVGAHVDAFEYCPHHVDGVVETYRRDCRRRKPQAGMIEDLMRAWPVEREGSFLIGDKDSDLAAAAAAGIVGHLFTGGSLYEFLQQRLTTNE